MKLCNAELSMGIYRKGLTSIRVAMHLSILNHTHKIQSISTPSYTSLNIPRINQSITPPILPPSPPPLLPKPTIKLLLPQLPIHLIMRLTHPRPEILPAPQPRLIPSRRLGHPRPEVIRAHPAGIQAREEREEGAHFGLLLRAGFGGVGGCEGVEEGPG